VEGELSAGGRHAFLSVKAQAIRLSPDAQASPQGNVLVANIMQVLALAKSISGPFTALWVDRPAVYGGLAASGEHLLSPVYRASRCLA
jgi:hypothetical protein